ncbi:MULTISPECIES: SH3 domain-containing protein [unclassified Prochlorococcus]|uniref:SH3 domain-containing protein n=1 Tax=unclassified Prochlorococcus TaxID=2627481 RepID=UPI00055E3C39|nr:MULTISPECIES: SH3 domain-containing protein [unclassified Prochlorococcus]
MKFCFHWGCLLSLALFAPIALPAGGATRSKLEISNSKEMEFFIVGNSCVLRTSPHISAPSLFTLELGTHLRVIRLWHPEEGNSWLQVQLPNLGLIDRPSLSTRRGWINV